MPKSEAWIVGARKVRAPYGGRRGTRWVRIGSSPAQPSGKHTTLLRNYGEAVQAFGQQSIEARKAGRLYRETALAKKESVDLWFGFRLESGGWRWTGFLIESSSELTSKQLKSMPMIGTIAQLALGRLDFGRPMRVTAKRRRGRIGHTPEFWEQIAELRAQALKASPRKYVKWMREHLPADHRDVSEDTLRRWVRLIREGKKP